MTSDELYDLFRSDVVDTALPQLWSDDEVWRYMNDAYRMFARLTGGFPDKTSSITRIPVVSTVQRADVSPLILKFRQAKRVSDRKYLTIVNESDLFLTSNTDYNNVRTMYDDLTTGEVEFMIVGADRNRTRGIVDWVKVPVADDTIQCSVLRLPLVVIDSEGLEFDDLGEEHHESLLMWMKHRAYGKQDAETFDKGKSVEFESAFRNYCEQARLEYEKYKAKVRVVAYGGL